MSGQGSAGRGEPGMSELPDEVAGPGWSVRWTEGTLAASCRRCGGSELVKLPGDAARFLSPRTYRRYMSHIRATLRVRMGAHRC